MANLLLDIISYLVAQGIATGDGIDCFRDNMPPSPDAVISIFEYPGGGSQPGVECSDRLVQIQVRALTYSAAREKANQVYGALNNPSDPIVSLTATRWAVINGRVSPYKLLQDENERTVFACSVTITTFND